MAALIISLSARLQRINYPYQFVFVNAINDITHKIFLLKSNYTDTFQTGEINGGLVFDSGNEVCSYHLPILWHGMQFLSGGQGQ
jgi:hypothetical protein